MKVELDKFEVLAHQFIQNDDLKNGLQYFTEAYENNHSSNSLVQKCLLEYYLVEINNLHIDTPRKTCKEINLIYPNLALGYLIRVKIELYDGNLDTAIIAARQALSLNPENRYLEMYITMMDEQLTGNVYAPFFPPQIQLDEALKKVNSDARTCRYSSDHIFLDDFSNLFSGKLDILKLEKDERIRQAIDVVLPNPNLLRPQEEVALELVLSEDENGTIEIPPPKIKAQQTDAQRQADQMKMKGNEQFCAKNLTQAIEFYERAIELDPLNPVFYSNTAAAYFDMRKYNLARQMCMKALQLSMEHGVEKKIYAKILARLGNLDQQENNYKSAIHWYKKSIKFNDADPKPQKNLKLCESRLRNERRKALWNTSTANDVIGKAKILVKDEKYNMAIEAYQNAIKYIPDNEKKTLVEIQIGKANCNLALRHYQTAIKEADKALEHDKDCSLAYAAKGIAFEALKLFDLASTSYTTAIRIEPGDSAAKDGLDRCLRASFVVRNEPKVRERRVLANPTTNEILGCEDVKKTIAELNANQMYIKNEYFNDSGIASKFQNLIDNGLIKFISSHAKVYPPYLVEPNS